MMIFVFLCDLLGRRVGTLETDYSVRLEKKSWNRLDFQNTETGSDKLF